MKKIEHLIEALLLYALFGLFRLLPLDAASWLGGAMGRAFGPFFGAHTIARDNLAMIFPEKTPQERRKILTGMWDHLGRVAAEFPHLPGSDLTRRMEVEGLNNLPQPGVPVSFISGHVGNWELTYSMVHRHGIPVILIYRQANNPYTDKVINRLRASHSTGMFPKGSQGAIRMAHAIKKNHCISMLIDQKMNDGIAVPFFGRPAMTAPAVAKISLRYDLPIIPVRAVRTKGAHFKGTIYPALEYEKTGDEDKDVMAIMTQINALLEEWIREFPEQWFWVHKRWPSA